MRDDPPKSKPEILVTLDHTLLAAWVPVRMLGSPPCQALGLTGWRILARILIARAHGRHSITFRDFIRLGNVSRGSVAAGIAQLELLGLIRVARYTPRANGYALSEKYQSITSLHEARKIARSATNFGLIGRKRRERKTTAIVRAAREKHHQEDHHGDDRDQDDAGPAARA